MALEAQDNPFTSILMVGAADPEALPDADPTAGSFRFVIDDTGAAWIVDDAGVAVAIGGSPFVGCSVSGTSTAISAGTYASLAFAAADTYDTDSMHDPASNNTRLIAPTTRKYRLTATCSYPSGDTERRLAYRVNGGTDIILERSYIADVGAGWYHNGAVDLALSATDYVEVRAFSSLGGTVTVYRAQLTGV